MTDINNFLSVLFFNFFIMVPYVLFLSSVIKQVIYKSFLDSTGDYFLTQTFVQFKTFKCDKMQIKKKSVKWQILLFMTEYVGTLQYLKPMFLLFYKFDVTVLMGYCSILVTVLIFVFLKLC